MPEMRGTPIIGLSANCEDRWREQAIAEQVTVRLSGAPKPKGAFVSRIDEDHANPRRMWQEMGAPTYPSASQLDKLSEASKLTREKQSFKWVDGTVTLEIDLPPHAVASIQVDFRREGVAIEGESASSVIERSGSRLPRGRYV